MMTPDKTPSSAGGAPDLTKGRALTQPLFGSTTSARELTPAAQRALAEAAERRRNFAKQLPSPTEIDGRGGLDPSRYGDWEARGIVSDF